MINHHTLLARQLKKANLSVERLPKNLEDWKYFLNLVENAFSNADQDHYTIERSMEISSKEMSELNDALKSKIFEANKNERLLQNEKYYLKEVLESVPGLLYFFNEEGYPILWNKEVERVCGYSAEELSEIHILEFFEEADKSRVSQHIQKILVDGWTAFETNLLYKDKTKVPYHFSGKKITYKGKKCIIGIAYNISDRKIAEHKNQLAAKVFENSSEGIIMLDSKYNIVLVNKAFTIISGLKEEKILGCSVSILYPNYKEENQYDAVKKSINSLGHWEGEIEYQHKEGRKILIKLKITELIERSKNEAEYILIAEDITEVRAREKKIEWQAGHDFLTELPNQVMVKDHFNFVVRLVSRGHMMLSVLYLDIDLFKRINDTFGHPVGDKLLIEYGKRLQSIVREEDVVSRLGGDEFLILLMERDVVKITLVVNKIIDSLKNVFKIEENEFYITTSIGISIYPEDGKNFDSMLKAADMAMFKVKQDTRDGFQFTSKKIHDSLSRMLSLENKLCRALENHEFSLLFQPQVSLHDNRVVGIEALIRWENTEFGMVSPTEFVPLMERTGRMKKMGTWILHSSVEQLKNWMDNGLPPMTISVNVSASQFYQTNFCDTVKKILEEAKLLPQYLELELTEAIFVDNPKAAIMIMNELKQIGINCLLDDFGTGYSSLAYLKNLPFSKLKIDKSFVNNIFTDMSDEKIVKATIVLAKSFGMKTLAEGAETLEQVEYLRTIGCDEVQGYYFSKPLQSDALVAFLKRSRPI